MRALDRKLLRDMRRLWAQSLAVGLVMASGVATLIIGQGGYASLLETRSAYYERSAFADIFADAVRAPKSLERPIRLIPGVAEVETRASAVGLVDIPYFALPVSGRFLSLPDNGTESLNRLTLVQGRLPQAGKTTEVVINESFAKAHEFLPGSIFAATVNGRRLRLTVSGIGLSPEFIYAIGPGDLMPDDRRFGIIWMREHDLASVLDMKGAFNTISLRLMPGAKEESVMSALDEALERYGGTSATGRDDQISHAFLDAELKQLATMSRILPPIFLVVTAFLINMILSRLIGLEREQIGLLKAIGYSSAAISLHYIKLVIAIASLGVAIGFVAGTWLGYGLTQLYKNFFHFPYLIFLTPPSLYAISGGVSVVAALLGASTSVYRAAALPPAVAMQPPAPPVYKRLFNINFDRYLPFSQLSVMAIRHIFRWPARSAITTAGIAVSASLLVSSLFSIGAVDFLLDFTFDRADRQDVTIFLNDPQEGGALQSIRNLPGVIAAEPYRSIFVEIENGPRKKRVPIYGKPAAADISRVLDANQSAVTLPESGIVLSETLAQRLGAKRGDRLHIRLFREKRRAADVTVTDIIQSYFGLMAFMEIGALNRLLGEQALISGAHVLVDPAQSARFFQIAKRQPVLSSIALQRVSLANFRKTIAENINIQIIVYTALGGIIAFGVVYNSARIQFAERARELASLRVLGFTEAEVSRILLMEFALFTAVAIPVGWLAGYGLAYLLVMGFRSDLYRVPFIVTRDTFAWSGIVVIAAVALSTLVVRRRVNRLDLISVLKTRD